MNPTTAIINILTAMGAKPIATTDENNTTVIKVNAPILNDKRIANDEKAEIQKTQKLLVSVHR